MADKNRDRAEAASEQDLRDQETDQPTEGQPPTEGDQPPTEQSGEGKPMSDVEETAGGRPIS